MATTPNKGNVTPLPKVTTTKPKAATPAGSDYLTGASRDAAKALIALFTQYGLGSLAPKIIQYLQQGFAADTVALELQDTAEYKQRFAANEARIKKGLPALSPAEYVSTERSYRQLMASAGLPVGFYDKHEDFKSFLENDISPTELKDRIDIATEAVTKAPKETLDFFGRWYDTTDMIAYALDPKRAAPLVEQRLKAAEAAGIGKTQGVDLSQQTAETIGQTGANLSQLQQGLGFVGQEAGNAGKVAEIYGDQPLTADDLVKEAFLNDSSVSQRRTKLASQERATFSNRGGVTAATLGKDGGQI